MLTTSKIRDLITAGPAAHQAARGLVAAEERFAPRGHNNYPVYDSAGRAFLEQLRDTRPEAMTGYKHPGREARATSIRGLDEAARRFGTTDTPGPLTPADIAWINSLPAPEHVSYRDAVELAGLAARTEPGSADDRLVRSRWEPVRHRHDLADAQAQLAAARAPWPALNHDVVTEAFAAALGRDPEAAGVLTDAEIHGRANDLTREAFTARDTARAQAIEAAQTHLTRLEQDHAARTAVTAA
jgi:hypothetical protein